MSGKHKLVDSDLTIAQKMGLKNPGKVANLKISTVQRTGPGAERKTQGNGQMRGKPVDSCSENNKEDGRRTIQFKNNQSRGSEIKRKRRNSKKKPLIKKKNKLKNIKVETKMRWITTEDR